MDALDVQTGRREELQQLEVSILATAQPTGRTHIFAVNKVKDIFEEDHTFVFDNGL